MREVYLDYSATTPVKKEVLDEMIPYFSNRYGNPSSLYGIARDSKEAVEEARKRVASILNADPKEIFFTSCGTEADNWAIFGTVDALKNKGNHMITTKFEHHAVLHSASYLEKRGLRVTYLPVDEDGIVDPVDLENAIEEDTILVSIMHVNNEIGSVQNIKKLAEIAHKRGVRFHTDSVQALGNVECNVKELDVDMMSVSAHKIYGPKGIGALYVRRGTKLSNFLHGGGQESKKRGGTENLTGIVGFGKAAQIAKGELVSHVEKLTELRDYFIERVTSEIEDVFVNGSMEHRHPGNANITFKYIEGEAILILLDQKGISVSTGSACSSTSLTPSHVLEALGVPVEMIHGTVRFTVGDFTTKDDIDYVVENLKEIVSKLRIISSVNKEKGW